MLWGEWACEACRAKERCTVRLTVLECSSQEGDPDAAEGAGEDEEIDEELVNVCWGWVRWNVPSCKMGG